MAKLKRHINTLEHLWNRRDDSILAINIYIIQIKPLEPDTGFEHVRTLNFCKTVVLLVVTLVSINMVLLRDCYGLVWAMDYVVGLSTARQPLTLHFAWSNTLHSLANAAVYGANHINSKILYVTGQQLATFETASTGRCSSQIVP